MRRIYIMLFCITIWKLLRVSLWQMGPLTFLRVRHKTSCENTQFFQHTVWRLHLTRTDQASSPHRAALHYSGYTAQTSEVKLVILWMKHLLLICWMLSIWIKKSHGHAFDLFKWKRDLNVNLVHQLPVFIWFTSFSQQRLEEKNQCLSGMPTSVTFSH